MINNSQNEEDVLALIKETTFEDVFRWITEALIQFSKNKEALIKKAFEKTKLIEAPQQTQTQNSDSILEDIANLFNSVQLN